MGTRPTQSTFKRLDVTTLHASYLNVDSWPPRSKGAEITLADFSNLPGFITSANIVQSDLSVTDPANPAFVKGQVTLSRVAYTGNAADLIGSMQSTQLQADWAQQDTTSISFVRNKPQLAAVATQGRFDSLLANTGQPVVPTAADASIAVATGTRIPVVNLPAVPQQVQPDWLSTSTSNLATIRNRPQLSSIATSGAYNDLQGAPTAYTAVDWNLLQNSGNTLALLNKPNIPAAQTNSDWGASTGVAAILNKPTTQQLQQQILVRPDWAITDTTSYGFVLNKPAIPAPQQPTDWLAASGVTQLLNRPTLAKVATSGVYGDLQGLPTIPAPQVASDWQAISGVSSIANRPTLASVATSGRFQDLSGQPTLPNVVDWNATSSTATTLYLINKPQFTAPVQANWGETDSTQLDFIRGKPQISRVGVTGNYSDLQNIPASTAAQQAADWTQTDSSQPTYILHKPALALVANSGKFSDLASNTGQPPSYQYADWTATSSGNGALMILHQPTIPAAQVQSDYGQTDSSQISYVKGKPQLASVATSGSYTDLINIPPTAAAQQQADYTQTDTTQASYVRHKPTLSAVAGSGLYSDLVANSGQPTVPTSASWTLSASTPTTLAITGKPTALSAFTNDSGFYSSGSSATFGSLSVNGGAALNGGVTTTTVSFSGSNVTAFDGTYAKLSGVPTRLTQFSNDLAGCTSAWNVPGGLSAGSVASPTVQVGDTQDSTLPLSVMLSSLVNNSVTGACFGPAASTGNRAELIFHYVGAGSSGNYASLGLYGLTSLTTWGSGNVGVGTGATAPAQQLTVAGTFSASGAATFAGTVAATGAISGPVQASSLAVSGAATLSGSLQVSGSTTVAGLTSTAAISGPIQASSLTASGTATFSSTVNVNGALLASGIQCSSLTSTGNISGPVQASSLSASGATNLQGNLTVGGSATFSGPLGLNNTTVSGTLAVSGATSLGSDLTMGNDANMILSSDAWGKGCLGLNNTISGASTSTNFMIQRGGAAAFKDYIVIHADNTPGAGVMIASPGAVPRAFFDTNTGYVGINKQTPQAYMDVNGNARISASNTLPLFVQNSGTATNGVALQLSTPTTGDIGLSLNQAGTNSVGIVQRAGNSPTGNAGRLAFVQNLYPGNAGTEQMCIQQNGYVGINKQSPAAYLDVNGNAAISGDTALASTLEVAAATTLSGTLSVSGATTAAAVTCTSLNVSGATTAAAVTCSSLTTSGTTLMNTLNATTLTVGSSFTCTPNATFSSNVSVNQGLTVTGATTTNGITNNGQITSAGVQITTTASGQIGQKVYGPGGSGGTIAVDWSTFTPNTPSPLPTWRWLLTDAGNGSSSLALQVAPGPQSSTSVMSTALTLAAGTGNATFTQPFTLSSTLSVAGAATMGSISAAALTVSGQTTLNGASSMTGAVTIAAASSLQAPYVLSNATSSGASQVSTIGPGDRFLLYPPITGARPFGLGFNSAQVRVLDAVSGSGIWQTIPVNVNGSHRFELGSTVYLEVSQTGVTAPQGSFYVNGSGSPLAGLVTEAPSSSSIVVNTQVNFRGLTAQANAGAAARIDTRGASPFQWFFRAAGSSTETQVALIDSSGNLTMLAGVSATAVTATSSTVFLGNNRAGIYRTGGANPVTYLQANDTVTPDTTLVGGAFLVDTANSRFSWQARAANSSTDTTVATLSFTTGNFQTTGNLQASGGFAGPVAATTLSASAATTLSSTLAVSGATTTAGIANTGTLSSTGAISGPVAATTLSASGAATLSSTLAVSGGATTAGITNTGTLSSTGAISGPVAASTLSASGAATLSGTLAVSGATTAAAINCTGLASSGTLSATGALAVGITGSFGGAVSTPQIVCTATGGSNGTGRAFTVPLDLGDLVTWRGTNTGDAYGFGQYQNGSTRLFASGSFSASSIALSFATNNTANVAAGFTDVLRVSQNPYAVAVTGTLSVSGASTFNGNITLTSGSSPSLNILNTAGNGVSSYINVANYTGYTNGYPLTMQFVDSNYAADLVVLSKTPGSASNSQVERFRVSGAGAVSMAGQLSSGYHYITGVDGNSRSLINLASGNSSNNIVWGQALSNNNSAVLAYNNATASTVLLGIYGSPGLTVDANGTTKVPKLQVGTSTDTSRQISCLQSGLATNTSTYITVGQDASNNNQAELAFNYSGSGSSTNKATLGLYAAPVLSVDGNGNLNVPGRLTSANRYTVHLYTTTTYSLSANTASVIPLSSWATSPVYGSNNTPYSTATTTVLNSNGYWVVPATGVWAITFTMSFSSSGTGVNNQVYNTVLSGTTDPNSSLTPNTNQKLGVMSASGAALSASYCGLFFSNDIVAPVMLSTRRRLWQGRPQQPSRSVSSRLSLDLHSMFICLIIYAHCRSSRRGT